MDPEPYQTCTCGRTFSQPGAFIYHQRSCSKSKKCLVGALAVAKEAWANKRRRVGNVVRVDHEHIEDHPQVQTDRPLGSNTEIAHSVSQLQQNPSLSIQMESNQHDILANDNNDLHLPLADRRTRRQIQLPVRFRDVTPQPLALLPPVSEASSDQSMATSPPPPATLASHIRRIFQTPRNIFGLYRRYQSLELPSRDPEENVNLQDLVDSPTTGSEPQHPNSNEHSFYPYPNENSFLLGDWYWNSGIQKSLGSFKELLRIVGHPRFRAQDVEHTNWNKINAKLGRNDFDEGGDDDGWQDIEWLKEDAGWKKTPITISVPFHSRMKRPGSQNYIAGDLYHRSIVSIIREKLTNAEDDRHFHYDPFELIWNPNDTAPEIRVHGEIYTSPAFIEAHRKLQDSHGEPGCTLPRVVIALMFASDATHLTHFGTAKLWPSYLYFGNESKYRRCKPNCHLCNHVAYFQTLPDAFKDFTGERVGGRGPGKAFMTHCRRELFQAQWDLLIDEEFLYAYQHGIVIECCDGILRRFYPRIFSYSADYPEKVLIATIRSMGRCPCPRCLIPISRFYRLGMKQDMQQRETLARIDDERRRNTVATARDIVYNKNYAVNSKTLQPLLTEQSLVPTSNAFSQKLSHLGFNVFSMLVVDIMHEFELGVWKALFIHLLRILESVDKALIHELDRRFRLVPSFGKDTIRRFSTNISELKKLAARDFEDLLQCAIPVFDGLFPEPHNSSVMRLLFTCTHWHGLAKLRMHTDISLDILDQETVRIGTEFRTFANNTCSSFQTRELRRETETRKRRRQKQRPALSHTSNHSFVVDSAVKNSEDDGPRPKTFNLDTFKFHSLGDCAKTIRQLGTTDSYSTELSELEHRTPKARYKRTDRKLFIKQMARIERREARLRQVRAKYHAAGRHGENVSNTPQEHHHIGYSQNNYDHIGTFLRLNSGDPATKGFLPKLKEHLLSRVLSLLPNQPENVQPSNCSSDSILFKHDRLYRHNVMRINFTTYDCRRSQEAINTFSSHNNIMVLNGSCEDQGAGGQHPFRYARVLGVYHANLVYVGPGMVDYQPIRVEFLWVRWYKHMETGAGWESRKLDCVHFLPVDRDDAFGFINPSDILRTCHLIPAFARGKLHLDDIGGLSRLARDSSDWAAYYVNRFVDRDMVMRYHIGLGVGHMYFQCTDEPPTDEGSGEDADSDKMFDPAGTFKGGSDELDAADRTADIEGKEDSYSQDRSDSEDGCDSEDDEGEYEDDGSNEDNDEEDEDDQCHSERSDEELVALDEMYM